MQTYISKFFGILFFYIFFSTLSVSAQVKDSATVKLSDSIQQSFVEELTKLGNEEKIKSLIKFNAGRVSIKQEKILQNVLSVIQKAKDYLKRGIDSSGINHEIEHFENWIKIASDGIFENKGTAQTFRNLATSSDILKSLLSKALKRKKVLDTYHRDLIGFRDRIDSLASDSTLYVFSSDSTVLMQYVEKLLIVSNETTPTDNAITQAVNNLSELQKRIDLTVNRITSSIEEIEVYQEELSRKIFEREFSGLWGAVGYSRPFKDISHYSIVKGTQSLILYVKENIGKIILLILLIAGLERFLTSLKNNLSRKNLLQIEASDQLVFRYPLLSGIMIVLSTFQFAFTDPPFIFSFLIWFIASLCLIIIFKGYITKFWFQFWITMFVFFLLASVDNILLQASRTERWFMFLLASAGVIAGIVVLFRNHRKELKESAILYFIGFVVLLELFSVIANLTGRYNLSKTLLTSGYFSILIATLFLWTIRLINEILRNATKVYKNLDQNFLFNKFDSESKNAPSFFYILMIIGWVILLGHNFYAFKLISAPIKDFLFSNRTIGNYTFSISSVLIFFIIMIVAVLISRIVSFFAGNYSVEQAADNNGKKKVVIGSWILLVRITIICLGLFFAFAATGIPIDKITIILGALSVGIGLGLQALVNNLVSGLIIAFEKPVNVGDIIDVAGTSGIMKSIGFRSSVISTWEGADVIIPNGDLLNAHLINWTLSGNTRRADIVIGVGYDTDLPIAKQLLLDIMKADDRIINIPPPGVFFQEFNSSTIDIKILFWLRNYQDVQETRSALISKIQQSFKEKGIEIPFPQQDVNIHSFIKKEDEKEK